ncbi:DNA-binding transcriptional regulator, LysR family [Cryptosporangium aurantiacum]|uniref:DNA-binding transcriptional regulator, LysR family n=1 Tax=Cryptosporangium aurantiacum TaxID=134849 RepID=A0A1M7TY80_9ACTN|nr:DNA-binding transcriptional regulator, LysR family [Cryptosporangium aurantiacum]
MPDIDLRHLRYLIAVAADGAITSAADRLGMTQPALSRAIRALEADVGVPLLVRRARGVALTEAGSVLVAEARELTDRVDAAVNRARRAAEPEVRLRVSARGCDIAVLQDLTRSYNNDHADAHAEALVVDGNLQSELLRTGGTELALIRAPFDADGLDSDVVAVEPRVVLLPSNHPLADRGVVDRAELAADPVVVWASDGPAERAYALGVDRGDVPAVAGPEVGDVLQLLARVRLGDGIAFVATSLQHAVALPPDVRMVPVNGLSAAELRLVWRAHETSPHIARFVRHAVDGVPVISSEAR